jgi:lysophospholipase L1-like esterase
MGKLLALGDSTVAAYAGGAELLSFVTWTAGDKVNLAVPGDTIADQKAAWTASSDKLLADLIIIQVGLNDVDPDAAATVAIAALQDLVDTVIAGADPAASVCISKMTPAKERWVDLFGPTDGATAQTRWEQINDAIAGNGATPITGVTSAITAHVPLMADGSGNLAAAYDTGDGIHPNDAGRAINAEAWQDALDAIFNPPPTTDKRSKNHVARILAASL